MKENGEQIAALPMRLNKSGKLHVLLVTSRETKRWIVPKGWTIKGKSPWAAAEIEAREEAGAVGHVSSEAMGEYGYDKILDNGAVLPCRVRVYPMAVRKLQRRWKEQDERKRRWFAPKEAAELVDEADLAAMLRGLAEDGSPPAVFDKLKEAC